MKKLLAAGALALMSMTGSAQVQAAPTTISFNGGSGTLPANETVFQNFDSFAPNSSIGTNAFALSASSGLGARPAFGSTGNFASVLSGGSFTTSFSPASAFSFVLGSLDVYNSLTLFFTDGTSTLLTGGAIVGSPTLFDSGSQTDAQTNGVVTYTATGARISGATFASTGNSFEFDNLAAAVPEPAMWGMMILGFGLVGGALRRRSTAKVSFA